VKTKRQKHTMKSVGIPHFFLPVRLCATTPMAQAVNNQCSEVFNRTSRAGILLQHEVEMRIEDAHNGERKTFLQLSKATQEQLLRTGLQQKLTIKIGLQFLVLASFSIPSQNDGPSLLVRKGSRVIALMITDLNDRLAPDQESKVHPNHPALHRYGSYFAGLNDTWMQKKRGPINADADGKVNPNNVVQRKPPSLALVVRIETETGKEEIAPIQPRKFKITTPDGELILKQFPFVPGYAISPSDGLLDMERPIRELSIEEEDIPQMLDSYPGIIYSLTQSCKGGNFEIKSTSFPHHHDLQDTEQHETEKKRQDCMPVFKDRWASFLSSLASLVQRVDE